MAYKDYIVRDLPAAAWALDEYGVFRDYSGNGLDAGTGKVTTQTVVEDGITYTTTQLVPPRTGAGIVSNSSRAILASNEDRIFFPVPLFFMSDDAGEDFTIETWFRPYSVTEATTVLGHEAFFDGIVYDGEAIKFVVKFLNSGTVECIHFPPVEDKVFHVVGQRSANRVRLFVDGLVVSEVVLNAAQNVDVYALPPAEDVITSGFSTLGTSRLSVDGTAIYNRSISDTSIAQHYFQGRNTPDPNSVIEYFGGAYWDMTDEQADIARHLALSSWEGGVSNNVYTSEGVLYPEIDSAGLTYGGNWTYGTFLGLSDAELEGSKIEWDSDGAVTIQTSLDDEVTWTNCTNGLEIPGLGENFDATNKTLSVRVLFLQGEPEADTISKIRSLNIILYRNRAVVNSEGNQFIQFLGNTTLATKTYTPIDRSARMGANFKNTSATITPVNVEANLNTAYAISFWIKPELVDEGKFLIDLRTGWDDDSARMWFTGGQWFVTSLELYIDGLLTAPTPNPLPAGEWAFVTLVFQEPTQNAFKIASSFESLGRMDCRITNVAVYRERLGSEDVGMIYRSYLGLDSATFGDQQKLTVTDSTAPPKFYAFNWSYMGV